MATASNGRPVTRAPITIGETERATTLRERSPRGHHSERDEQVIGRSGQRRPGKLRDALYFFDHARERCSCLTCRVLAGAWQVRPSESRPRSRP
jgi:hypothetical protein